MDSGSAPFSITRSALGSPDPQPKSKQRSKRVVAPISQWRIALFRHPPDGFEEGKFCFIAYLRARHLNRFRSEHSNRRTSGHRILILNRRPTEDWLSLRSIAPVRRKALEKPAAQ